MEQEGPRKRFNENFYTFINRVELTQTFMELIQSHPCSYMVNDVMKFKDRTARKCRIFSEFTRERDHCEKLADMLQISGQPDAANELREYNTSEIAWPYVNTVNLEVVPAITLRSGHSRWYTMDASPRGRAHIFVTVDELDKEAQRWKSILEAMFFAVTIHRQKSCADIERILDAEAQADHTGDAFIVIFIGHGYDEKVRGWREQPGDQLAIARIVDKFSETRCIGLQNKPKLFLFDCCRVKFDETPVPAVFRLEGSQLIVDLTSIDHNWKNQNKRTYVVYACAEGIESWYYEDEGFTQFGKAFSHTVAQFSWYKNLIELLTYAQNRLERELGREQRPEIRLCAVNRDLYFNPGLSRNA